MAPILSGNTLGLKFMQRGAAAKAATQVRKQEETKKQEEVRQQSSVRKQDSSEEEGSSSEESDTDDAIPAAPVASTSRLPPRTQSSITTESSYLAFPILSSAYGVASSSETSGNSVNGRFSFGKQPKPKKPAKREESNDESESDGGDEKGRSSTKKQEKKPQRLTSISGGGGGGHSHTKPATPSIREQQKRARAAAEAERDDNAEPAFEYEEDTSFVDDMMEKARQKRQLDGGQKSRPKKRKSANGAV